MGGGRSALAGGRDRGSPTPSTTPSRGRRRHTWGAADVAAEPPRHLRDRRRAAIWLESGREGRCHRRAARVCCAGRRVREGRQVRWGFRRCSPAWTDQTLGRRPSSCSAPVRSSPPPRPRWPAGHRPPDPLGAGGHCPRDGKRVASVGALGSYGIYLWHQWVTTQAGSPLEGLADFRAPFLTTVAAVVVLSSVAAAVTHWLVERPASNRGPRSGRSGSRAEQEARSPPRARRRGWPSGRPRHPRGLLNSSDDRWSLRGGFLGVDVFLALSAFLIGSVLRWEVDRSGNRSTGWTSPNAEPCRSSLLVVSGDPGGRRRFGAAFK